MKKLTLLATILMTANLMFAQIINIPDDYPTIQQGINAATDDDTVLVQPGTYIENINFNGKNIVVASLVLTTQDTSFISQTTIDGNYAGSVVIFDQYESSSAMLYGFTIRNGHANQGGGIYCSNASPTLQHLIVRDNVATHDGYLLAKGGGVYCEYSSSIIEDATIMNNTSQYYGGGIYFYNTSNVHAKNLIISNNSSDSEGGGIQYWVNNSTSDVLNLENIIISNNFCGYHGGGINTKAYGSIILKNAIIRNNMANVEGGGIRCSSNPNIYFDQTDLCNIYSNSAASGNDIFSYNSMTIYADTFSVINPTNFHVAPSYTNFTFSIQHGLLEQVDTNLYVSPTGDNSNSGLIEDDPLKTIHHAVSIILPENTIYLSEGTYSPSSNNEFFPVNIPFTLNLIGDSSSTVILDPESLKDVIYFSGDDYSVISGLTATGGNSGIRCYSSSINDVIVTDNESLGIFCHSCSIENSFILGNNIGVACWGNTSIENVIISDNNIGIDGNEGYYDQNTITNVLLSWNGLAIRSDQTNIILTNVTAAFNGFGETSVIRSSLSNIDVNNCIFYGNDEPVIDLTGGWGYEPDTITISYSNIQGGEEVIITNENDSVNWQEGNIDEDPLFVTWFDDYQLSAGSPCIDAGTPDTTGLNLPCWDLLGNKRIWDGDGNGAAIVDMGAYEYGATPVGIDEEWRSSPEGMPLAEVRSFPNPVSENCMIEFEMAKPARVSIHIYNNMGELLIEAKNKIYSSGQHQVNLNFIDLKEGIYFCRVQVGNEMVTKKIIKL